MKRKLLPVLYLAPVLAVLGLLLSMPLEASEGARSGLALCAGVVVPSLLPFLILSGLAAALGLPELLSRAGAPLLARLGIPPEAAAPLLLGLTGGYPVGASALAQLVRDGRMSPEAAGDALPWCNNTGPGFIVGFTGAAVFGSVQAGMMLYLCHAAAAFALAFCGRKRRKAGAFPPGNAPDRRFAEALPACIQTAAISMLTICAYVVFFSVLTALLRSAGVLSALAVGLSARLGLELRSAYALLNGLLELSGGIGALRGAAPTPGNAALAAFLLGFGGLSVHCQTLYAVSGTKIKCARHFAGRIVHGLCSALLAFGLFSLLTPPQI